MKLKTNLFVLSLLMMTSIAMFTSCSSDDDDGGDVKTNISERILGAWTRGISEIDPPEDGTEWEEPIPAFEQSIEYYTADNLLVDIWLEYDANMNIIYTQLYEGTYSINDNKMKQKFIDSEYDYKVSEKNDVLKLSGVHEKFTLEYKRISEKIIQPYLKALEVPAPSVWHTGWQYDEESGKNVLVIYSYEKNGNIDRYTAIADESYAFERAYVEHGTWQMNGLCLSLTFNDVTTNYLQRISGDYLTLYYYDAKGNQIFFNLDPTTLDAQQGIIDAAEEVEE